MLISHLGLLTVVFALLSAFVPRSFSLPGVTCCRFRVVLHRPFCEGVLLRSRSLSALQLEAFHVWILLLDALYLSFNGVQTLAASQWLVRRGCMTLNKLVLGGCVHCYF